MNQSINDIINQYRNGGTGKSNAVNIADYYNQQIANVQSGQANLANVKNGYTPEEMYKNQTVNLYQNAQSQANMLSDEYKKALEQQSLTKQYAQKYLNTQLGMQGLSGVGSSESSANAISSQYSKNIANLQNAYNQGLTDIEKERANNQLQLDTNLQNQLQAQEEQKLANYSNALQNATSIEDVERVKKLYGDIIGNTELDNSMYYKMQDLYTQKVDTELGNAIESGNDSKEALTKILNQYKDVLSNEQYAQFESAIENEVSAGELSKYVAEGTEPISINAYTSATELSSIFNYAKGEKQTKYYEAVLNALKSGEVSNGSFVRLNYGNNANRDDVYYVYNNKLYKVDAVKGKAGKVLNSLYIPEGYKLTNKKRVVEK